MTTKEILDQLYEKYKHSYEWVSQDLISTNSKNIQWSFALRPYNMAIELDNETGERDRDKNVFLMTSFDQVVEIIDQYFNLKRGNSRRDDLKELAGVIGVDVNGPLYLKFFLTDVELE